jgi:hypothetical protein
MQELLAQVLGEPLDKPNSSVCENSTQQQTEGFIHPADLFTIADKTISL